MAAQDVKSRLKNRPRATESPIGCLYSMLPSDLELLESLADRFNEKGARINNSEVVRAGLAALKILKDEQWVRVISQLPKCAQNKGRKRGTANSNNEPSHMK